MQTIRDRFGTEYGSAAEYAAANTPATTRKPASYDWSALDGLRGRAEAMPDDLWTDDAFSALTGQVARTSTGAANDAIASAGSADLGGAASMFLQQQARQGAAAGTAGTVADLAQQRKESAGERALQKLSLLQGIEGMKLQGTLGFEDVNNARTSLDIQQRQAATAEAARRDAARQGDRSSALETLSTIQNHPAAYPFPGGWNGMSGSIRDLLEQLGVTPGVATGGRTGSSMFSWL